MKPPRDLAPILELFRTANAVAIAELDPSGVILDANAGFLRLVAGPVGSRAGDRFLTPGFAALRELSRSGAQPFYEGPMAIGERAAADRPLRGVVGLTARGFSVILEHDVVGLEDGRRSAIALADDLARAHRDLLALNQRLRRSEEALRTLVLTDPLTGLANRRKLDEVVAAEYARVRRYGSPLSLAIVDVDSFKRVNDEFGHQAGDSVLQALAALLRSTVRAADLAARHGGDEFAVLMPSTGLVAAGIAAERIRRTLEQATVPYLAGGLTASVGVAELRPDETVEALFQRADAALYRAKQLGRNRVQCDGIRDQPVDPQPG